MGAKLGMCSEEPKKKKKGSHVCMFFDFCGEYAKYSYLPWILPATNELFFNLDSWVPLLALGFYYWLAFVKTCDVKRRIRNSLRYAAMR